MGVAASPGARPTALELARSLQAAQTVPLDDFFNNLKRPGSPNNWLVAPADFVIRPDAVAPVFRVPLSVLRDAVKGVVLRSRGAEVVEESANAIHVIATTPLVRFKDDVRVLFIPVAPNRSTVALYSASRVGFWDMGANRRRLENWTGQLQNALGNSTNQGG